MCCVVCVNAVMCWCVDDFVECWCVDYIHALMILCWCVVFCCWYVDVLMCWCVEVLMCWCIDVLMSWCVDVLMCSCDDLLMSWCVWLVCLIYVFLCLIDVFGWLFDWCVWCVECVYCVYCVIVLIELRCLCQLQKTCFLGWKKNPHRTHAHTNTQYLGFNNCCSFQSWFASRVSMRTPGESMCDTQQNLACKSMWFYTLKSGLGWRETPWVLSRTYEPGTSSVKNTHPVVWDFFPDYVLDSLSVKGSLRCAG